MKILFANKFLYERGGSEIAMLDTARMMKARGHSPVFFSTSDKRNIRSGDPAYFIPQPDYSGRSYSAKIKAGFSLFYSIEARKAMEGLIREERPDIAHLNNIYHQISPSIIHALKKAGVPIVMTLHDYKMVCPSYSMLNSGRICHACRGGRFYNCFLKSCLKSSRPQSLVASMEMYLHHKIMNVYSLVDAFISPSGFLIDKLLEMGFKDGELAHIPNFINSAEFTPSYEQEGYVVYLGRLSGEKGLPCLLEACRHLPDELELRLIGDGPLKESLEKQAKQSGKKIVFLGHMGLPQIKQQIAKALCLVLPSECFENNPRCVLEAFALGKPAVASRIGGIPELVIDGKTGLLFEPGNALDLAQKIKFLCSRPQAAQLMGREARRLVEETYTPEKHYSSLLGLYSKVRGNG